MILTKTRKRYEINFNEKNLKNALKETMFFRFLQDVATQNADENGFGYNWIVSDNLGWFLLKYRIEFSEYPENMDYIEIDTIARGANRLFTYREFTVFSPENEPIGKIMSMWALMDMTNKTMVNPCKVRPEFNKYEPREDDLPFNKIEQLDNIDYETKFVVRFDDIDVNNHANNTNYIAWGLDALPNDFRMKHCIKNIDMQFKKEIKLGKTLISRVAINEEANRTVHYLYDAEDNEVLCCIGIEWQ